jgi:hypothetical protein
MSEKTNSEYKVKSSIGVTAHCVVTKGGESKQIKLMHLEAHKQLGWELVEGSDKATGTAAVKRRSTTKANNKEG